MRARACYHAACGCSWELANTPRAGYSRGIHGIAECEVTKADVAPLVLTQHGMLHVAPPVPTQHSMLRAPAQERLLECEAKVVLLEVLGAHLLTYDRSGTLRVPIPRPITTTAAPMRARLRVAVYNGTLRTLRALAQHGQDGRAHLALGDRGGALYAVTRPQIRRCMRRSACMPRY
jgi:hypothetical protein